MASRYPLDILIDDRGFNAWLESMKGRLHDMEMPMQIIGDQVVKSVRENFLQGGRPEAWHEWADATVLGRLRAKDFKKKGGLTAKASRREASRKILIGSGMRGGLMDSIHAFDVDDGGVSIGPDNRPYARIHQLGGMAGRNKSVEIPARPYLVVQDEDVEMAKRIILVHLVD